MPLKTEVSEGLARSPPSVITVDTNATATELFAARSLESRLRATVGLRTAHVVAASATTVHAVQMAVGFGASLAAGIRGERLHGLGNDGYPNTNETSCECTIK
jgi:hypothetical protein